MGLTGSNQGRSYLAPKYDDPLNEHKPNANPRGEGDFLDIAIKQLDKNPLAYSLSAPKRAEDDMETKPFNTVGVN
jgi:hypothetical protein